jgi:hypothetical protein
MRPLRNSHAGETCYIIGDGISLKHFDLGQFSNHISIVGGKVHLHADFVHLNARYWVNPTPLFWSPPWALAARIIRKLHSPYRLKQLNVQPIVNVTNLLFSIGSKSKYFFDDFPDRDLGESFITKRFDCFASTTTALVTMAIYMGFSEAYLVGIDYTHRPSRLLHWYEKGEGVISDHSGYYQDFFQVAQEFIKLTTVTLDGSSDVLPFITYKELTGKDPHFRDNSLLVKGRDLKLLKKLPFYEID